MREIFFNSDITPRATNEIKLLALYYDKVYVVNDAVYSPKFDNSNGQFTYAGVQDFQFIPKSFETDYKVFIDEKIISTINIRENEHSEQLSRRISTTVNSSHNYIFPKHPTDQDARIITEEVYEVMKYMFDFDWGKPIERELVWWYYSLKLNGFLKLLMEGKTCLSSSNNLNYLFSAFIQDSVKHNITMGAKAYTKSIALDALKLSLPNPDPLSFNDILELKSKLKDELALFSQTINSIEVKLKDRFNFDMDEKEYQSVFFNEIQKPLGELEIKMKNLKSKTFRSFIDKMQNPKSYVPLIGTVVGSLPLQYALLASLGLTTGQSYLEYKESKREIVNNGLYFLLKLRG